jgi:hypothetical protein
MDEAIRWFHRIQEFEIAKAENRSVRANRWCEERGLNKNSFRYWRRKFINDGVRTEEDVIKGVDRSPQFVEISGLPVVAELHQEDQEKSVAPLPALRLTKNDLQIELAGDADDRFLLLIREVIANA